MGQNNFKNITNYVLQFLSMKKSFLIISFLVNTVVTFSQPVDSSHHVPENKNLPASWKASLYNNQKRTFKGDELLTIGMPCGGIAAGQLYVRGDGTLANWWIYNNAYNTGYGVDSLTHFNTALGPWTVCYKTFEPKSYIDQGFNIKIKQDGKTTNANLNKKDFDDISFVGEYPIATINYNSTDKKITGYCFIRSVFAIHSNECKRICNAGNNFKIYN